jgi:hypothetical protein
MHPWGDDWRQTAKIVQTLYGQKGISVPADEIIPRVRRVLPDPRDLGKKLWFGFKALAGSFKKKA